MLLATAALASCSSSPSDDGHASPGAGASAGAGGSAGVGAGGSTGAGAAGGGGSAIAAACSPGDTKSCSDLAGLWASGSAACRSDGQAWDVSSCAVAAGNGKYVEETVYPANRDPSRWGDAVCNADGNFAFQIYYPLLPGGQKPTQWIIELQGGGMCFIEGPEFGGYQCFHRALQKLEPDDANGQPYPPDRTTKSAGYDAPPGFETAIRVNAGYCSSDLWTGRNTSGVMMGHESYPPGEKHLWKFTGQINFEAMLDVLQERYGLDDSDPSLAIHFRGQSAGGAGVLNNAFIMAKRFPNALARNDLVASSWQYFFPTGWADPDHTVFGAPSIRAAMDIAMPIWQPGVTPACAADHPGSSDCVNGVVLYDYVTKPQAAGGLGMNTLVFFNRQDQLYMNMASLPGMSDSISPADLAARKKFADLVSEGMGITVGGVPQPKARIPWLFAPSDPQWPKEPNVHPPLTYEDAPPDGPANSLESMTKRFWEGRHDPAIMAGGEQHIYDCNWVTGPDTTSDCH
jgi:hypothetical protein